MSKWEWKKLGEVCEIICGQDYKDVECESGAYPVYGSGGVIGYAREFRCPANCTIVGRKGSINNPMYVEEPFWNIDTAFGLSAKECMESKYLFYFCKCFDFTTLDKSSGRPSLARKDLLEIQILIPPLSEQKRIVKFLDEEFSKIDTLKTNAETNLKNVKDLFKVELLKEFSTTLWEKKKLGEVYNFIDYRGVTPNKLKEGIPLITAKNVRMGYIDYSVRDFISESDYKKRQSRGIAHKGDILFTTEAPLGFSAIADLDVFSTGQRVIVFQQFKNEKNICNPFFNWYFQSIEFQRMIKENATGLTATGIKASRLKEIKIPLPPLSVQKEIVARLDKLSENVKRLEANYKQIIDNCDELKKTTLKQTFQGGN